MLVWAAVSQLAEVESSEQDPERLKRLYHTDHALARIRRVAENLQVLAGAPIEDPGCQITTVLDVVRAAASAVEHYQRVTIGSTVELAVAEIAADDVIRILTELIDNAVRYSPPATAVTVSAHLTDAGHVLVRVEDTGIGVDPQQLPRVNAMLDTGLDGGQQLPIDDLQAAHLGLPVVARLTQRHRSLRVRLTPHQPTGTTAMLLIGDELVCEVPRAAVPIQAVPVAVEGVPEPRAATIDSRPAPVLPSQRTGAAPMPRRVPASVRNARPATAPPSPVAPRTATAPPSRVAPRTPAPPSPVAPRTAWTDDAADFNAGVDAAVRAN
jgi:anti-sigma regulatory factor (Ser/Thr protein kinase)